MTGRRLGATAVVAVALAVAAGCSDGGEDRLSTEEFLEQGNAACEEGNAAIEASFADVAVDADGEPDPAALADAFETGVLPAVRDQIDAIRALEPPEDLEADLDQLLADADAAVDEMTEQLAEDPEAFVASEDDPFADVNAQATALGLTACGE